MRRIETEAMREQRTKRNSRFVSIIMVIILLGSVIGGYIGIASINKESGNSTNQGAVQNGNSWVVSRDGQTFSLGSSPSSVKDIPVNIQSTLNSYRGNVVYIASDNTGILNEVGVVLSAYASRVQLACYGKCDKNLPEKNCTVPLIVWTESNETEVYQQEQCVFLQGDIKSADAFLYKLFGM